MRKWGKEWGATPEIVAAIPRVTPPFPPGMKVQLSDNTVAAVVAHSPKTPYQPMVRQFDTDGWTLSGRLIDLAREEELQIKLAAGVPVAGGMPEGIENRTARPPHPRW